MQFSFDDIEEVSDFAEAQFSDMEEDQDAPAASRGHSPTTAGAFCVRGFFSKGVWVDSGSGSGPAEPVEPRGGAIPKGVSGQTYVCAHHIHALTPVHGNHTHTHTHTP